MAIGQDCLLCGATASRSLLCDGCTADLPLLPKAHCPQCAAPSPHSATCGRCLAHPPHFDRTVAVWRYEFPADRLLQSFKYGARLALAGYCAEQLALAGLPDADLIVPLPLHPRRLAERGFNQAVEIARPLARRLGTALDVHALGRVRDTVAQAGLPLAARAKNIRGAFACKRDLAGLRVALVDDVMTTGATLNEAAHVLKRAGAVNVTNWVVARTP